MGGGILLLALAVIALTRYGRARPRPAVLPGYDNAATAAGPEPAHSRMSQTQLATECCRQAGPGPPLRCGSPAESAGLPARVDQPAKFHSQFGEFVPSAGSCMVNWPRSPFA